MKACTKCNVEYECTTEFFSKHSEGKFGLRPDCKLCESQRNKVYQLKNVEKIKERKQVYYSKNRKDVDAKNNEWVKNNREARRLIARKHIRKSRAIKSGNMHQDWTEKELFETYGTDCYLCNQPIDFDAPKRGKGSKYSSWPDHVIPNKKGGENTISNVRPCHRTCNESKGNKTYEEYMLTDNSQEIVTQPL